MHLVVTLILIFLSSMTAQAQPEQGKASAGSTGGHAARQILDLTNRERVQRGLNRLAIDPACMSAITSHVSDMASGGFLSHQGRDGRGANERYRRYKPASRGAGENLAYNASGSGAAFMQQWLNSSSHRSNILNATYRGIGVAVRANCSRAQDGKCTYYAGQCFSL
jgi:uncharacterized protein YkwD